MHSDFPTDFFGLELDLCVTWARMHACTQALSHTPRKGPTTHANHTRIKLFHNHSQQTALTSASRRWPTCLTAASNSVQELCFLCCPSTPERT